MRKNYPGLVIIMLILVSAISVTPFIPRKESVDFGPVIVSAGGEGGQGSVTIVFEDRDLVLGGKEVAGDLIVSFGGETYVVSVEELGRVGRVTFVFSEGLRREGERMRSLYSYFGVKVGEGMSGGEIIRLLRERGLGGVRLPAITLTLWLVDEDGNEYVLNEAFTSVHYYVSRGLEYHEAFEKAFQDPLAVVREGPTLIIPSIESLREFLVRVDSTSVVGRLIEELGIGGRKPTITSGSQDIVYVENYLLFPQTPPEFFRNKVSVLTPGVDEEWLENEAWQNFVRLYASAYLFKKSRFTTPKDVREYLSGPSWGWCSRDKYLVNFESILSTCLNPSPAYSIAWNHTKAPGTFFNFYKPYVITVVSNYQNLPPLVFNLVYGAAQAGYTKRGFTFLGALVFGSLTYYITMDMNAVVFTSGLWQLGRRHAALIVPATMQYNYDALFFKWVIRDYDQEYWIAVPVPVLIPHYEEIAMISSGYWSRDYYNESGNRIVGDYNYVSNIYTLLYNITGALKTSEYVLRDTTHSGIPSSMETIDNSSVSGAYAYESSASVMFGVFMDLVSTLLGSLTGNPVASTLFSFLSNLIGYADTTFYGSAVQLMLMWVRDGSPQDTPVRVVKITGANVNASYIQLGNVPLVAQYVVTIGQLSGPSPCPPNVPDCSLPENRTS
jgi:hypothetical protein